MSANAMKLQEENTVRLIKCRLRSEIKARKAVESTMNRAVQEARELKKELVLLRQEKEEMREALGKNDATALGSKGKGSTQKDDQTEKQGSNRAVETKLRQHIQTLGTRNTELEGSVNELQQQISMLESQESTTIALMSANLEAKDCEVVALQKELKKTKLVVDETKRKCQKLLKEKKEEAQRALQENEQLARCTKTLQGQLALLPLLKRQLEHAKKKRADVADIWQKKLEQRNEAFLRQEEANKQNLAKGSAQIAELTEEKQSLQARLEELERKLNIIDNDHQTKLHHEVQRLAELESSTRQLQEKLCAAEAAAQEAKQAEVVARETQSQETRLRQLAENAADAVEIRADKAEQELAQVKLQLERLEEALQARGVTLDYLLKQQAPTSVTTRTLSSDRNKSKAIPSTFTRSKPTMKPRLSASDATGLSRTKLRQGSNNDEE